MMTEKEFKKMYGQILGAKAADMRAVVRSFTSDALSDELDKQGRFVLPQELRDYAKFDRELAVIGVGTRLELWDKATWEKYRLENYDAFQDVAGEVF